MDQHCSCSTLRVRRDRFVKLSVTLGIILISSDLPEVLAMSDRILVLHEGRVTAEIPRGRATQERVMFAATGSTGVRDQDAAEGGSDA